MTSTILLEAQKIVQVQKSDRLISFFVSILTQLMAIDLEEVYHPPDGVQAVANICFVHGLFGGPRKTFSTKRPRVHPEKLPKGTNGASVNGASRDAGNGGVPVQNGDAKYRPGKTGPKEPKKIFWPEELLPKEIDNVRIFTFGYDADVGKFMGAAGLNTLYQNARNLLNSISDMLKMTDEPLPVVFIAHSLGGLIVKQALNQSATREDSARNVLGHIRGIIFLGTPHHGSKAANYGGIAYRLNQLSTEFCETLEKTNTLRMWSFSEEKQIRFGVIGMQIVPADSAKINHIKEDWGSISGDHSQIAKYSRTTDDGFKKVSGVLKKWVKDIIRDSQRISSPSEEYQECLKTLDDAVARLRVRGVHQVSQENPSSFEWLFTEKVPFVKWLQDDTNQFGPLFWITGRPGSGKSTLMRFALENQHTVELLPKSAGDPIAYFFGTSKVQKSLKGMLKELLCQLLHQFPHFYAQIGPIYRKRIMILNPHEWDLDSLTQGILQIPKLVSNSEVLRDRVFLFIDALDENENQEENETMMKLIKRLSSEYESTAKKPDTPLLKICLASRSWPFFKNELGSNSRIPSFAMHDFTTDDIQLYASRLVEEPLQSSELPATHHINVQQLVNEIIGRAKGVFVWVRVVVDSVRRHRTDGTPIEVLSKMVLEYPKELKELYEYTVTRIPNDYWQELEVTLKVLFSSRTALTLTELYVITQLCIGHEPSKDLQASRQTLAWLASRSGGLIEEINISPTVGDDIGQQQANTISSVQFIHQTVQDFVRAGIRGLPEPSDLGPRFLIPPGHQLITLACLRRGSPHPCLSRVTQKFFLYFRACESDWDAGPDTKYIDEHSPWDKANLIEFFKSSVSHFCGGGNQRHDFLRLFMDEVDRANMVKIIAGLQGEDLAADKVFDNLAMSGQIEANASATRYDHSHEALKQAKATSFEHHAVQALLTTNRGQSLAQGRSYTHDSANLGNRPARARLRKAIRGIMALQRCNDQFFYTAMFILQNLYHPHLYATRWEYFTNWSVLAALAAVGRRLAEDRTDRPRMLKRVLQLSNAASPLGRMERLSTPSSAILDVKPAPEIIWNSSDSPLAIVVTALPSGAITDMMLRYMAELLLEVSFRGFGLLNEKVQTRLQRRPYLSLMEFWAIFKGQHGRAWQQLMSEHPPPRWPPTFFERAFRLKMGRLHEGEMPDMCHGLVFPGLAVATLRGVSFRYLYQGFEDPKEKYARHVSQVFEQ